MYYDLRYLRPKRFHQPVYPPRLFIHHRSGGTAPTSSNAIFIGAAPAETKTLSIDAVLLTTQQYAPYQEGKIVLNGALTTTGFSNIIGNYSKVGPVDYSVNLPGAGPNSAYFIVDKGNTGSDGSIVYRDAGAVRGEIGLVADDSIHLKTVSGSAGSETYTDRLTIATSGETSVGTVAATAGSGIRLDVNDSPGAAAKTTLKIENLQTTNSRAAQLQLASNTNNWSLGTDVGLNGGNNFAIQDNNFGYTPRLLVDSSGNIAIGGDTPGAKLDIQSVAGTTVAFKVSNGTSTGNIFQAQDNGSDTFVIGDGGSVSATPTDVTKTITLGGTGEQGQITLGQSTDTNTISIGGGNTATGKTQTIQIGAGTPTGTGVTAITIGNNVNGGAVTVVAGTGNINLNAGTIATNATTLALFNTNAATVTALQAATSLYRGYHRYYYHQNRQHHSQAMPPVQVS